MAEKVKEVCLWYWENRRAHVILGAMILLIAGMMTSFFLTYEEEPQIVSAPVIAANEGYGDMEQNPLCESTNGEINQAVEKYYTRLLENADYVEAYENMKIYMKKGIYEDTYIVYVRYNMKIKGIDTSVPGLGTLYVEKTEKGKIKVESQVDDVQIQKVIALITEHEDVRTLFGEVESAYAEAVRSDAVLAEVLNNLQNAAAAQNK